MACITKRSILDVWQGFEYISAMNALNILVVTNDFFLRATQLPRTDILINFLVISFKSSKLLFLEEF